MITWPARLAPALLLLLAGTALAGQRGQPDRAVPPTMSDPPRACCPKHREPEFFRPFPPFAVFGQPFVYLPPAPVDMPPAVTYVLPRRRTRPTFSCRTSRRRRRRRSSPPKRSRSR